MKHCYKCDSTKSLIICSRRILKSGKESIRNICNKCNSKRAKKYYRSLSEAKRKILVYRNNAWNRKQKNK